MKEIYDLTGKPHQIADCLSCEILNKKILPFGGILYKDDHFLVMQDVELPIDGFIIISSVRHIEKFTDLTNDERINLSNLIDKTLNILRNNNIADEYNIILEEKKGSHFHIWLMPRHSWMIEKFGKVLKNIKSIQDYALENLRTPDNINKIAQTCNLLKHELNKEK